MHNNCLNTPARVPTVVGLTTSVSVFCCQIILIAAAQSSRHHWTDDLKLPAELLTYTVKTNPILKEKCLADKKCPIKTADLEGPMCWGYEPDCKFENSYSNDITKCDEPSNWPTHKAKKDQLSLFYHQGDFGHISDRLVDMKPICKSKSPDGSFFECSDHLRHCRAKNIFFDLKSLDAPRSQRYREDVIHEGEVGGRCDSFDSNTLKMRSDHLGYLQSWAHELQHFRSYPDFIVDEKHCDRIFDRPTYVIKLDAAVNMFHHFCDFINLYASQHINGSFDLDVDIVLWDTAPTGFADPYFGATWRAFSTHKPVELIRMDKKKVCFRNAVLSLLARQRLGLYYNMPVVGGCSGTGLFHAFSHHVLHRLGIKQQGPLPDKVRITFLSRGTKYRRALNEDELLDAMRKLKDVEVQRVDYTPQVPFLNQLQTTHNSDIFIGMHGSGLTHLLFLPDWAAIFELYNCEDARCYWDLARLRGVQYYTWEKEDKVYPMDEGKHPTLGTPHKKFTNYRFDVPEFVRIVENMIAYVRKHPQFAKEQRRLGKLTREEL